MLTSLSSFNGIVVLPHSSTEQLDQILLTQEFFLPTKILFWLAVQMPFLKMLVS